MNSYLVEPEKILQKTDEIILRRKDTEKGPLRILNWDVSRSSIFMDIDGIDDVNKAESLMGFYVLVRREHLEVLPEGEYYWHELIGMIIVTEDGEVLGKLTDIFSTGSNDVYVCTSDKGEMLIPAISDVVLQVDMPSHKMVIRILKGMDRPC